jgi:hypothetical protein
MESGPRSVPPQSDSRRYVRPPDDAYETEGSDDEEYHRFQAVNNVLLERLVERITGRGEYADTVYDINPKDQFFAGALASQYQYREAQASDDAFGNIATRVAPFTMGLQFKLPPDVPEDEVVTIQPSTKVFYRRLPTLEEQRGFGGEVGFDPEIAEGDALTPAEPESDEDEESSDDDERDVGGAGTEDDVSLEEIRPVYERVELDVSPVEVTAGELRQAANSDQRLTPLRDDEAVAEAMEAYRQDPRRYREPDAPDEVPSRDKDKIPETALEDEETFDSFVESRFSGETPTPVWDFEVEVGARPDGDDLVITVSFVNTHGRDYPSALDPKGEEWRAFFFDVNLRVETGATPIVPFVSDEITNEYHYDPEMDGLGKNCSVERTAPTVIETVTVPIHEQRKYRSRETLSAPFSDFGWGTIEQHLERISEEMAEAREQYESMRSEVLEDRSDEAQEKFDENLRAFEKERRRFDQGRRLIREDVGHSRSAFKFMNQTFDQMGEKYQEWYLFQIIYIVMAIPDVVAQTEDIDAETHCLDEVDVIYFPTGGGKTEAYLGLVVFTAFRDRLRGKSHGTTALTKFPLRLLSLQQLQRIADVFAQAELIRRRECPDTDEFSLGYFVGSGNTPNQLMETDDDDNLTDNIELVKEEDSRYAEKWKIVTTCPFCGEESVELDGDYDRMRLLHRCTNGECSEDELPIHVTDREVYRYAPTFVVSTIDKIAVVGMQRRFRTLFGRLKKRCEKHGFSGENRCLVANRGYSRYSCEADVEDAEPVDPPSILIQDELHLLREEFGAFDSHYETFLQEWASRVGDGWQMKNVTATATIKGADKQVHALYWKDANIYPSPGPLLKQSFYAYEDPHRLGRRIVGSVPHNVSRTFALVSVLREYADIVQHYQQHPEEIVDEVRNERHRTTPYGEVVGVGLGEDEEGPGDAEERVLDVLDYYDTQVAYNIQKVDSDRLQRAVPSMINPWLATREEERHPVNSVVMSGETGFDVVREVLDNLESEDPEEPVDIVNATSMISHGVDVDTLNFISFFGMPRQTAEYIQAYSRVGRDVTGTVFDLFNPVHVRDRSHYTRFDRYHDFQDLLVEATPLERWAEFAVDCTLPGIFAAILLQYYDEKLESSGRVYLYDHFREAQREGDIDKEELLNFVKRAYRVTGEDLPSWAEERTVELYEKKVEREFEDIWERCMSGHPKDGFQGWIGNMIKREEGDRGPMRSLRDIDEQLPIDVDTGTAQVMNMFDRRK